MKKIELLAPAKNLETGKIAVNYGADAVYIGAARFGARAAAGNSMEDIENLTGYAHKYNSKVFVTLNTILYDSELEDAEKLIWQIYNAGADALIIQDMGVLLMDLPPIALHASTQTHNYNTDRIKFLNDVGFERIVLARELSLTEIGKIRKQTTAELEFFIHGALCVSFSGQCYFSEAVTGRSANRGNCSQMCRHPYNLIDRNGKKLALNSHLLSLKDLNLSHSLKGLLDAGIQSLKIEGRLKDGNYVKNVVTYYRQKLDSLFSEGNEYAKCSSGYTKTEFIPDPERSFARSATDYFVSGRKRSMINSFSPKSTGKRLGKVREKGKDYICIDTVEKLNNGDGLCFIRNNELFGLRVEKVIGERVFVNHTGSLEVGTFLFRNFDHEFNKLLESDKSIRRVGAVIIIKDENNSLTYEIKDEDNLISSIILDEMPVFADNKDAARKNIKSQLTKSGNSMFEITEVLDLCDNVYFFRAAEINSIRRKLFEAHEAYRMDFFKRKDSVFERKMIPYPATKVDFRENVANSKAEEFYKQHGVKEVVPAMELGSSEKNQLLMTTRYCIKFEMGFCKRHQKTSEHIAEPLFLEDNNRKYILEFDCNKCVMYIRST